MTVLPDTSVWVDYLRVADGGPADELDQLLHGGEILVCGPVAAELVAGTSPSSGQQLWRLLTGLRWHDLDREDWRETGAVAGDLRARGQALPLTDVAIAVASVRSEALLWTRDRDFTRIRAVLPALELYREP